MQFDHVSKWFGAPKADNRVHALDDINFSVPDEQDGEILAILGPSGSGKSTVLNLIAGLMEPDQGQVLLRGERVELPNPQSVTVPQAYTCFPWLTVAGNVEFGLGVQGKPKSERREIAMEYLKKVNLEDRANAYPRELSGGMQQRVAIARALAMKPPIVLMDEPFGALDAQIRSEMQEMLLNLWTEERNLIVFVTHDITEAVYLADRIIVFSPRPARIVLDIKVSFERPRHEALKSEPTFTKLANHLLDVLRTTPTSGEVRVSV